ncbi:MAG: helix-turn-helix domain-containing protein [Rhodoferax sp.]|nr:helix-turn-helix domain-containing protein [Rhodoferax sp.]
MGDVIDSEQCAELLLCTQAQVEELARIGDLPAVKIGRSWLFIKVDLILYLAERARAEAQERRARRQPSGATFKPRRMTPPPL